MFSPYYYYFFLTVLCSYWDLSLPSRDQTLALSNESTESHPLDCQGIPLTPYLKFTARSHHFQGTIFPL